MANEAEVFGLPSVYIDFKSKGTTAIKRSARGIVAMILKQETTNTINTYKINDVSDIPSGLSEANTDLVKKCLLGTPLRVLVYTLPLDTVKATSTQTEGGTTTTETLKAQADVLKLLEGIKWNWLCAPTATTKEQEDLASWIKSERSNKRKTFKAVLANQAADNEGVVNFTSSGIKVADGGTDDDGNATYKTYTALEYTARICGILAGLALDRSATYYKLTEVAEVDPIEEIDSHIDKGELVLFDEQDGDGVKIGRACNSLTSFTTDKGEDFRYIKIIEAIDMITDDIRDTFKKYYVGKVINDYDHKELFISAIKVYFSEIAGNVLDRDGNNTVDIDEQYQRNYAKLKGEDVENMSAMDIRKYNTGTNVVLAGSIKPVNAMEDLKTVFTM